MNGSTGDVGDNDLSIPVPKSLDKENMQSSLEMYEMYSPNTNKLNIPYFNNPVIGLVQAASESVNYSGGKNLTLGNLYYNQGRYERAIENYILNIMDEKYSLIMDRRDSLFGLSSCYLRLGDVSSSINYLHKAVEFYSNEEKKTLNRKQPFVDICSRIKDLYQKELSIINNSLDRYEFIDHLLAQKSGWELALQIVDFILTN